ncbi:site-specific DNA-methyltransferase [Clostridiales bacterium COT073_COT-073]|nr:site-specific DNA-methyltransferase [Clostridiales bacterium COT073_COT-073]
MANLSKIRREKMLEYLEKLKIMNHDDEHIRAITEIENALNQKKYGLVWEEHSEKVDEMLEHNIPVFVEQAERKIVADTNEGYNFLLEGDNLHSLKILEKTHKGKIDIIYIDPPYNTKNKEFIYDDRMVGEDDGYRHSKWISFMQKRLEIALALLSKTGAIFISIDDNEQAELKMLCDSIFMESNYITSFIRKTKSMTGDDGNGLNIQHEYMLVYARDKSLLKFKGEPKNFDNYSNPDNDPNGIWCAADPSAKSGGETTYFAIKNPYTGRQDFPPKGRFWAFSKDTMEKYIESGRIKFKEKYPENQRGFIFKRYAETMEIKTMPVDSLAFTANEFMNSVATSELKNVLSRGDFNYPKPTTFIKQLVKYAAHKEATILDFFAGSGTTGHAVIQLNQEDGGNRKYILCTNNENHICEEITYQRLKNIQAEFPHNLKYYKTDFIPKFSEGEKSISEKMMEHIKELIELEYAIELDHKKYIILDDEDKSDEIISEIENNGKLFICSGIFLSRRDQRILEEKGVSMIEIPEYYFRDELREVGEG